MPGQTLMTSRFLHTAMLAVALALAGCGQSGSEGPGKGGKGDDKPVPVETATVTTRQFTARVDAIATLRAREAVTVTARSGGRVEEILFREGAQVTTGAVLVRLEDDEERANYNAAKVNAELQASRYARIAELLEKGLASQDERDTQAQALKEAQARETLTRVQLGNRTIRAPFAGTLGFRRVSPGALVQPGDAIVTLDALDSLRADFSVAESLVNAVATGARVEGRAAAWPGRVFHGQVTLVDTRIDAATRTVAVQARIDNRDGALKPGMLLTLNLATRPRATLFVPEAAMLPENARQYVWRIDAQQTATRVEVTPGLRDAGQVEILAGLSAGDRVAIAGQGNLRDGKRVVETAPPGAAATISNGEGGKSAPTDAKAAQRAGPAP